MRRRLEPRLRLLSVMLAAPLGCRATGSLPTSRTEAHRTSANAARVASDAGVTTPMRVVPWAGHRAAVSYTFDDALPSQLTEALPLLDREGVHATFFVTTKNRTGQSFDDALRRAVAQGSELGNHTVNHCHLRNIHPGGTESSAPCAASVDGEIDPCTAYLEKTLGAPKVTAFAYPFIDTSDPYVRAVRDRFLFGRSGGGGSTALGQTPDFARLDAKVLDPAGRDGRTQTVADWLAWIGDAERSRSWLIFVVHSLLPENIYEGVAPADLAALMSRTSKDDLFVDTLSNVGTYFMGQRILETAEVTADQKGATWTWSLPARYPQGRTLLVRIDGGALFQGKTKLEKARDGTTAVALDPKTLRWVADAP